MDDLTLDQALDGMDAKMALSYTSCLLMAIVLAGNRGDIIRASKAMAVMDKHTDLIDKYKHEAYSMMNTPIQSLMDDKPKGSDHGHARRP